MNRSTSRWAAAILALALASAACAQEATENPLADRDGRSEGAGGDSGATGDRFRPGGPESVPAEDLDALVADAISDVEDYWERTYPDVYGGRFAPPSGGYHPYGPDVAPPACGGERLTYEELARNAFYCPPDDLIAWDEATLIPEINETFGPLTVGMIFAHEFAHAIQDRADVEGRTIDLELQADCYAGAWAAHLLEAAPDAFDVDDRSLDSAVAGMVAIRDAPGTAEDDPFAHGSGFDRIGSFQEGYEDGPQACADYEDEPRDTVAFPFDPEDLLRPDPGNLQLEDFGPGCPEDLDERVLAGELDAVRDNVEQCGLASLLEADLNVYYQGLLAGQGEAWTPIADLVLSDPGRDEITCGGDTLAGDELRYAAIWCEDENIVVVDGDSLATDLYAIGDFALGAEIARLWAISAQAQLGVDALGSEDSLQADCLTGHYAASIFPDDTSRDADSRLLRISPGDLDEGVQGFLALGDAEAGDTGTAFERTEALRTGVSQRIEGCEAEYGPLR
ncbi:MAG TPA: neutral zinc metallopeptidase [Acidimicrobiales bacterium]|nr:neutral zinc metallopeptidase [Acidimicrobiales bacterium]